MDRRGILRCAQDDIVTEPPEFIDASGNRAPRRLTDRREFLALSAGAAAAALMREPVFAQHEAPQGEPASGPPRGSARIAITLDLEMSRNFPKWKDGRWDYEKGNLDDATKAYSLEAARRVKAAGGVVHFFVVGRVFEQANVDWLKQIVQEGHRVGNHTYDHVNVKATTPQDIQYRFNRAPWLIEGKEPAEVIRENIRLCSAAIKTRLGIDPAGFRTPGGFPNGLSDRPDVRRMLRELGFSWVSSQYPPHAYGDPGREPPAEIFDSILQAQKAAQPFRYPEPDDLTEIPMSPISDIGAFRNGRWKLEWFLKTVRLSVEWAIEHQAVFDFLGHPSCLYVTDPEFRTIDLICDLVRQAGDKAAMEDLNAVAEFTAEETRRHGDTE